MVFQHEITEGKESWRTKKEHLYSEYALLEALRSRENSTDISNKRSGKPPTGGLLQVDETLYGIFDMLTYSGNSTIELQQTSNEQQATRELSGSSEGPRPCLTTTGSDAKSLCVDRKAGETETEQPVGQSLVNNGQQLLLRSTYLQGPGSKNVLSKGTNKMIRWWQPCDPICGRHTLRLAETRMTEVDGRLVQ